MNDKTLEIKTIDTSKVVDRSANKPTYLVTVESPELKTKVRYYKAQKVDINSTFVVITGFEINKAQTQALKLNPNAPEVISGEVNITIPLNRVISIENVSFKKQSAKQGE